MPLQDILEAELLDKQQAKAVKKSQRSNFCVRPATRAYGPLDKPVEELLLDEETSLSVLASKFRPCTADIAWVEAYASQHTVERFRGHTRSWWLQFLGGDCTVSSWNSKKFCAKATSN